MERLHTPRVKVNKPLRLDLTKAEKNSFSFPFNTIIVCLGFLIVGFFVGRYFETKANLISNSCQELTVIENLKAYNKGKQDFNDALQELVRTGDFTSETFNATGLHEDTEIIYRILN